MTNRLGPLGRGQAWHSTRRSDIASSRAILCVAVRRVADSWPGQAALRWPHPIDAARDRAVMGGGRLRPAARRLAGYPRLRATTGGPALRTQRTHPFPSGRLIDARTQTGP
jgi:hypothetical protein